jgi:hypothetical protein
VRLLLEGAENGIQAVTDEQVTIAVSKRLLKGGVEITDAPLMVALHDSNGEAIKEMLR